VVEGLTFLAGMYAAISSWVWSDSTSAPSLALSNLVVGIAVAVLAIGFAAFYAHTHGLSWVVPIVGIWLAVAPWVVEGIDRTNSMVLSNVIVGVCIALLCLGVTAMARVREGARKTALAPICCVLVRVDGSLRLPISGGGSRSRR
jgi:hypothetical protein